MPKVSDDWFPITFPGRKSSKLSNSYCNLLHGWGVFGYIFFGLNLANRSSKLKSFKNNKARIFGTILDAGLYINESRGLVYLGRGLFPYRDYSVVPEKVIFQDNII